MEQHCQNALTVADYLQGRPGVRQVHYPHLPTHPQYDLAKAQMKRGGGIVTLELEGGIERSLRFLNAIEMGSLSSNLGDTRTIFTHPATTTHSKLTEPERRAVGILPGAVRVSVGLEAVEDILRDIQQALDRSAN